MRLIVASASLAMIVAACGFTNQMVRTEKGVTHSPASPGPGPQSPPPGPHSQPNPPASPAPPVAPSTKGNYGADDAATVTLRNKFTQASPASQDQMVAGGKIWNCNIRTITNDNPQDSNGRYQFAVVDGLLYWGTQFSVHTPVILQSSGPMANDDSTQYFFRMTASGFLIWESAVTPATANYGTEAAVADPSLILVGYGLCSSSAD